MQRLETKMRGIFFLQLILWWSSCGKLSSEDMGEDMSQKRQSPQIVSTSSEKEFLKSDGLDLDPYAIAECGDGPGSCLGACDSARRTNPSDPVAENRGPAEEEETVLLETQQVFITKPGEQDKDIQEEFVKTNSETDHQAADSSTKKVGIIGGRSGLGFGFDTVKGELFEGILNEEEKAIKRGFKYRSNVNYRGFEIPLFLEKIVVKNAVDLKYKGSLNSKMVDEVENHYRGRKDNPQYHISSKFYPNAEVKIVASSILPISNQVSRLASKTDLVLWYLDLEDPFIDQMGVEGFVSASVRSIKQSAPQARVVMISPPDFDNLGEETAFVVRAEGRVVGWNHRQEYPVSCRAVWENAYPSMTDQEFYTQRRRELLSQLEVITRSEANFSLLSRHPKELNAKSSILSYDCFHLNKLGLEMLNELISREILNDKQAETIR